MLKSWKENLLGSRVESVEIAASQTVAELIAHKTKNKGWFHTARILLEELAISISSLQASCKYTILYCNTI